MMNITKTSFAKLASLRWELDSPLTLLSARRINNLGIDYYQSMGGLALDLQLNTALVPSEPANHTRPVCAVSSIVELHSDYQGTQE